MGKFQVAEKLSTLTIPHTSNEKNRNWPKILYNQE
jgi:hypothetical protein